MNISEAKEIIKIIKNEPVSILIIFSLIILPAIFLEWIHFFPESWIIKILVPAVISILWIYALYKLRAEIIVYRRKVILFNYLKKHKRHSIYYLSKEWAARAEFTEKNIEKLLLEYPDVFKRVKVKRGKEGFVPGVGLLDSVVEETEKPEN